MMQIRRTRDLIIIIAYTLCQRCHWSNSFVLPNARNQSTKLYSRNDYPDHDVIIVGGGIVGLATAATLSLEPKLRTHVYERATAIKPVGALLSIFPNGRRALKYILGERKAVSFPDCKLDDVLDCQCIPLLGTVVKAVSNGTFLDERTMMTTANSARNSTSGTFILWHQLQNILLDALSEGRGNGRDIPACLSLGCEFLNYTINEAKGLVHVTFASTRNEGSSDESTTFTKSCRLLIGADGIRSNLRQQVFSRSASKQTDRGIRSYQRLVFRALIDAGKITSLSNATGDNEAMPSLMPSKGIAVLYKSAKYVGQVFKIWTCSEGKIVAITSTSPINSGSVDINETGNESSSVKAVAIKEEAVRQWNSTIVKSKWKQNFSDFPTEVLDIIDRISDTAIYANCVSDLEIQHGEAGRSSPILPWSNGLEPVILVGDAVHAMTPSLGQGANVGLEDALELGSVLRNLLLENDVDDITTNDLLASIDAFKHARNDRVAEIHFFSRQQALNKQSSESSLKRYQEQNADFFERLYGWEPVFLRNK
ncbi:hypothetical protein ACHAXS_010648 [Conticribra weissflogii]